MKVRIEMPVPTLRWCMFHDMGGSVTVDIGDCDGSTWDDLFDNIRNVVNYCDYIEVEFYEPQSGYVILQKEVSCPSTNLRSL